ncbi:1,4-dihydroxy-2-naphthoyl-CoA synthase, partial [Arthrobacter deserti]|nr:1,4-dihydroxy-2-naphthoyl-CoA synthase [Arthrobacter deserti]
MPAVLPAKVSDTFDPARWREVRGSDFQDLTYHRQVERDAQGNIVRDLPAVRIAFNRPE